MLRRLALVFALVTASTVLAQDLPDAGLPDASVGEGGADRDTEEGDSGGGPCLSANECTMGFTCTSGRCVPAPVQDVGCRAAPVSALLLAGLVFLRRHNA